MAFSRRALRGLGCACLAVLLVAPVAAQRVVEGIDLGATGRTVRVNGDAEVLVAPDEAVLRLGVQTLDADLETALADNERAVAAVQDVARRAGVPAARIATDYLGLEPQYTERRVDGVVLPERYGYRVRRSVTVTLRASDAGGLGAFDALLRDAVAAGANHVHGVDFRTTELRRHRDAARAQAVQAAREKAEAFAAELGQTLGPPLSITEIPQGWNAGYGAGWGQRFGGAMQNVSVSGNVAEPVAPGQIAVRAGVAVTFALGAGD